jgi:hypothetical protein
VTGIMLHCMVDFDLQIPAISVLFVVVAALRRGDATRVNSDAGLESQPYGVASSYEAGRGDVEPEPEAPLQ